MCAGRPKTGRRISTAAKGAKAESGKDSTAAAPASARRHGRAPMERPTVRSADDAGLKAGCSMSAAPFFQFRTFRYHRAKAMRLTFAQLNFTIGAFDANFERMREVVANAATAGSDLVVF